MKLLHCTNEKLHLHAAFTPGHIRGCVYLECIMNDDLKRVLLQTIGINHSRQGLRYRRIDPLDAHKLLILPKDSRTVEVGDWVRMKKGVYKGDTAYIAKTHNWGVSVLLAPRLDYTPMDGKQQKRKHKRKLSTVKPLPRLFNPLEFHHNTDIEAREGEGNTYYVGRMEFVDGLLLKSYDFSSITSPVFDIPWNLGSIFAASGNMDVAMCIPRPQEWALHEHDKVVVISSGEKGSVHEIKGKHVTIDIGERGVHTVVWYDIRKDIATGDYVSVASGPHCGYKGWVMEINIDIARVLNTIRQDNNIGDETYGESISICFNFNKSAYY
jgi:transcription antitermination factor NusG